MLILLAFKIEASNCSMKTNQQKKVCGSELIWCNFYFPQLPCWYVLCSYAHMPICHFFFFWYHSREFGFYILIRHSHFFSSLGLVHDCTYSFYCTKNFITIECFLQCFRSCVTCDQQWHSSFSFVFGQWAVLINGSTHISIN